MSRTGLSAPVTAAVSEAVRVVMELVAAAAAAPAGAHEDQQAVGDGSR
jgi:hypothetical protein